MNICFLARPSFDRFSVAVFKKLREKYDNSISGFFITTNNKETGFIKRNIKDAVVFETSSYLKENWGDFNEDKLILFEKKYDCSPIWKYIYTDRFLIKRNYDYVVKITVGLFSFFEDIFSRYKVDFYYSECIATLQCYIAYKVGKKFGVNYISQMTARGFWDSTYHYFVRDEYQYNCKLKENYLDEEYSDSEFCFADKVLSDFESKDCPPPAMAFVKTIPRLDINFFLAPVRYIKNLLNKDYRDPFSYMYYQLYRDALNPIIFYFNYKRSKRYYKSPDFEKKFVYLPLHYQPEASTCVCAQKYEKQLFFIDSFAKSLPAGTLLYVKEHYALLGNRSVSFYRELKNYPNVVLIDPFESSRLLIQKSVAVAALTGTAGLEAVLLRKPVFVCGNAVYEKAPGVIKINDIYDNFVDELKAWKKPTREDLLKYICACFRTFYKGNAYAQNIHDLIPDNIDYLCSSLYSEMKSVSIDNGKINN